MNGTCFYCRQDAEVNNFENPYTHEFHFTCEKCKVRMSTYIRQRLLFTKLGCIGTPIFALASIMSFIFINWQVGVVIIVISVLNGVISTMLLQRFVTKRNRDLSR